MHQARTIIPAILLILVSCTNKKPGDAYQNFDCSTSSTIDIAHLGPVPIQMDKGRYPEGLGNSLVKISYRINKEGRAVDIAVAQTESDAQAVQFALRIVHSMQFDADPQASESTVSFRPGVHRTCQRPISL